MVFMEPLVWEDYGHGDGTVAGSVSLPIKLPPTREFHRKVLATQPLQVLQQWKQDMARLPKPSLLNLSVEEENLAAIPFAVLERRVGKRVGKIEIRGTKILPDGSELRVMWQIQGNSELGLPTEQDLDIFVALGVLTRSEERRVGKECRL